MNVGDKVYSKGILTTHLVKSISIDKHVVFVEINRWYLYKGVNKWYLYKGVPNEKPMGKYFHFEDYFYTTQELRKLKLDKLNEW